MSGAELGTAFFWQVSDPSWLAFSRQWRELPWLLPTLYRSQEQIRISRAIMVPPHMSLKCTEYGLKKEKKQEKPSESQMMCNRAGACGTACIQFQCTVFTSVSPL